MLWLVDWLLCNNGYALSADTLQVLAEGLTFGASGPFGRGGWRSHGGLDEINLSSEAYF